MQSFLIIITCIAKVPTPPDPPSIRTLHKDRTDLLQSVLIN